MKNNTICSVCERGIYLVLKAGLGYCEVVRSSAKFSNSDQLWVIPQSGKESKLGKVTPVFAAYAKQRLLTTIHLWS